MVPPSDLNNASGALSPAENASRALQPRATPVHPIAVSYTPAALSATPNALTLFKALRHRLGIALTVGLFVAGVVGASVWFSFPPPKTTARMQLHVDPIQKGIIFDNDRNVVNPMAFLRNQAHLIRDPFSFLAVLRNEKIASLPTIKEQADPAKWLEDGIAVDFPSTEFIWISLSGERREDLLALVAAVTKTYLDNYVDKERNEREAHRKKLIEVGNKWQRKLETAKKNLKAQQNRTGGINEESVVYVQQLHMEEIESIKRRITEVKEKILFLGVEMGLNPDWETKVWPQYAAVLNCLPGPGLPLNHAIVALLHDEYLIASAVPNAEVLNEVELDAWIDKDEQIVKSKELIARHKAHLARMKQQLQPRAFAQQSKPYLEQVTQLEKGIQEKQKVLRPLIVAEMRKRWLGAAKGERHSRDKNYRALRTLESTLLDKFDKLTNEHRQKLNDAGDLLETLKDIEQSEKLVNMTGEVLLRMEVEQDAPHRITLSSEEPIIVNVDNTKRKMTYTAGAAAGALFLILLAFSWFEFQSRKVYTPEEVVQDLGLQLVGTVPDHSPKGWLPWSRTSDIDSAYTQSMLTESVDTARTVLLHTASREQLQIVMVTSAMAGEGKTSLASHLAASLARAGRRTILVDSDLRNPTLHRLFERDRAPGLSELLRGEADLANIIGETSIPNLWLIPAGKAEAVALQALALDGIAKIFERLRLHYDFVLVDSCPVLPVADAMLVGQHVDAVIFSLLREVSRMPRVYAAHQRLAALGIRMLGAVINGTPHDRYPSDYQYLAHEEEEEEESD